MKHRTMYTNVAPMYISKYVAKLHAYYNTNVQLVIGFVKYNNCFWEL